MGSKNVQYSGMSPRRKKRRRNGEGKNKFYNQTTCRGEVPENTISVAPPKVLLVLDVNGLLADIVSEVRGTHKPHKRVGRKAVFVRPFSEEFLEFCFERFYVGIWSSRTKDNLRIIVDFLFGSWKDELLFCWDQTHCTKTGFWSLENAHKPLVLKELKKIWNKEGPGLKLCNVDFMPWNTLLVDDSPYKALCNPDFTAIFPRPYSYMKEKDNSLGPGGDLRVYLERLSTASDVRCYVEKNPFGQPPISISHPDWSFYSRVVESVAPKSLPGTDQKLSKAPPLPAYPPAPPLYLRAPFYVYTPLTPLVENGGVVVEVPRKRAATAAACCASYPNNKRYRRHHHHYHVRSSGVSFRPRSSARR